MFHQRLSTSLLLNGSLEGVSWKLKSFYLPYSGFTTLQAKGGYMSDMEGLITEPVVVVATWADGTITKNAWKIWKRFYAKRTDWEQEASVSSSRMIFSCFLSIKKQPQNFF